LFAVVVMGDLVYISNIIGSRIAWNCKMKKN
jgi:hypothetical protein